MASYSLSTLRDRIRDDPKRAERVAAHKKWLAAQPCEHSQKDQLGMWYVASYTMETTISATGWDFKENSPIKRIKWLCIKCDHEWVEDEVQL